MGVRAALRAEQLKARVLLAADLIYRVNAGGPLISDTTPWAVDTNANPSPYANVAAGLLKTASTNVAIDMSDPSIPAGTPMAMFQKERWDKPGGEAMQWNFPVTSGSEYEVRLHFAETWSGGQAPGVRVFDVAVEGATVLNNYDVFADVGGYAGVTHTFTTTVNDGALTIDFAKVAQNPAVKGIEVLTTDGGPPPTEVSFQKSTLAVGGLDRPTSLQFGPDGRLYVAQQQNGLIRALDIVRNGPNDYTVTAQEQINLIQNLPNHNDNGQVNGSVNNRLVTGILVTGTAANPVIYVGSADPRIGGGNSGADLNLDTNSGIISRLTWNGSQWVKLDLVRGLPRSEENHSLNGMQLDPATNTLFVMTGGNTNMGAPSNNFANLPEYALSAAMLSIDLDAIGETTYDLPTLNDQDRAGAQDFNDPFGGNDGKNQAILVPGGPVQVYAPGFRNSYDVVFTELGGMYAVDNGPNAGWGDVPIGEGPAGNATNAPNEPGVTFGDGLHRISGPGYYGGHPNPTRSNPSNTFNPSNPQSPVSVANPIESDYQAPGIQDQSLVVYGSSTNGIVEYTPSTFAGALQGDLLIASFDNSVKRVDLDQNGNFVSSENLFTNVGFRPLDVTVAASGPFLGSVWVGDIALDTIFVFEPSSGVGGPPNDLDADCYLNDDEIANGTNPNNPSSVPPDNDGDCVSNLLDNDDDNDTQLDNADPFAIDATNGAGTPVGAFYSWENDDPNPGGLLQLGFTGLMTNGSDDYESLFDPNTVTAGGAAGVFTVDSAMSGTAVGSANTQQQALQFGANTSQQVAPFSVLSRLVGPFNGLAPQAGQQMGVYIGTGDQDNFLQLVVDGGAGGLVEVYKEVNGVGTYQFTDPLSLPGPQTVDLVLTVDPVANTVQPRIAINGGPETNVGGPVAISASWLASSLALGVISTDPTGSGSMPVTWDYLGTRLEQQASTSDFFFSATAPAAATGTDSVTVNYDDSDIVQMSLEPDSSYSYSLYFDGSDVGLSTWLEDIDAFAILPDGSLLISTTGAFTVPGVSGGGEDILRFIPTSLGAATAGQWEMYFDGSDVGMGGNNVTGVSVLPDGDLAIATLNALNVGGLSLAVQDLARFTATQFGAATIGTWSQLFDGSANGLTTNGERLDAVSSDGVVFELSTQNFFSTGGVSGGDEDVFRIGGAQVELVLDAEQKGITAKDINAWHSAPLTQRSAPLFAKQSPAPEAESTLLFAPLPANSSGPLDDSLDINGDGAVSIADVRMAFEFLLTRGAAAENVSDDLLSLNDLREVFAAVLLSAESGASPESEPEVDLLPSVAPLADDDPWRLRGNRRIWETDEDWWF